MPVESFAAQIRHRPFSADELQDQIHRITQSRVFLHSPALQHLLQFLAAKSIEAPGIGLKEYTVGVEALGRRPSFDPKDDTIVRVQIYRLRQKLQEYFREEGIHDPILVTIPKGSYLPAFESRKVPAPPTPEIVPLAPEARAGNEAAAAEDGHLSAFEHPQKVKGIRFAGAWLALLAVLCILIGWGLGRWSEAGREVHSLSSTMPRQQDTAQEFWAAFLGNDPSPIIAYADAVFLLDDSNDLFRYRHGAIDDRGAPVDSDVARRYASNPALVEKAGNVYYEDGYTGTGDLRGVAAMVRFLTRMGASPIVKSSRDLTTVDLKDHNVIVLGSPFQNIAAAQLVPGGDFIFDDPDSRHELWSGKILNLRPGAGENSVYQTERDPVTGVLKTDYSLISIQPGMVPGRSIALLAGLDTTGTEGAAMFATSPSGVQAIMNSSAVAAQKNKRNQPLLFQALLKVTLDKGSDVLSSRLITVHASRSRTAEISHSP